LVATLLFTFAVGLMVFFIGSILFAFYSQAPEKGAFDIPSSEVFPKFIIEELPVGVKGLLVASVLSAAMSTISAVLNSVTTVTVADFYNRFAANEASVTLARVVTTALGLLGILLGGFAGSLGNVLVVGMKLSSFFGGPLVGLFLLGMLTRRAAANPAFAGLALGLGAAVYMGTLTDISFLWYAAISASVTYGTGYLASFVFPRHPGQSVSPETSRSR
jgi:Na+/proline symporter